MSQGKSICQSCCWYDEDWPYKCHNDVITCNWENDEEAGTCSFCIGWAGFIKVPELSNEY